MFPCTQCGLCCQNISKIPELEEYDLGNGVCKYFNVKNNNCMIYLTRPDICRIDKMYTTKFHKEYTKKEFYLLNADACNKLQHLYQVDNKYNVIIGE